MMRREARTGILNLSGALGLGVGLALLLLTCSSTLGQESSSSYRYPGLSPSRTAETITLTRGPYLQSVTTDHVIVVWETDHPASSRVDYGPTATYGLVVSNALTVAHHALTLPNLSPYASYHYQISSDGQPLSEDSAFRTAAPSTQTTFSFVALGDTRTNHSAHQSVISRIVTLAPDFVLHTGDFVEDGRIAAQWDTFFEIESDMARRSPLFGAIGNHERDSANYFEAFHLPGNERWYSFDYGNAHFMALQVDGYAEYASGSEQYAWLENDLVNSDRAWKIVFFHIPPYSSGRHGSDISVRDELGPLFAQHGVDLVLNGHDHDYERSVVSDVVYIVTGGGGAPLCGQENPNPYSVYFSRTHHCISFTLHGLSLSGVGIRPDGVQFDPFTIHKGHRAYLPFTMRER